MCPRGRRGSLSCSASIRKRHLRHATDLGVIWEQLAILKDVNV